jgi:hypothetical protein
MKKSNSIKKKKLKSNNVTNKTTEEKINLEDQVDNLRIINALTFIEETQQYLPSKLFSYLLIIIHSMQIIICLMPGYAK